MSLTDLNISRRTFAKAAAATTATAALAGLATGTAALADQPENLVIYVGTEESDGFDPLAGYWGYNGSYILFQSKLLTFDKDLNLQPDLAETYEISDDLLTYTFHLREGVKFSDGSDFTAEDVAFTYLTGRDNGACVIDLTMIENVEALDDLTVKFTLNKPWSSFLSITGKLGIVPEAVYDPEMYRTDPVGTGPFRLVQWDAGQQMIVEPNEYYYGTPSPFKRITLLFLDGEAAVANALSGQLDLVMVQPEYAFIEVPGMHLEHFQTIDTRGFNLPCVPEYTDEDGKVHGNNVTCDPAVRRALTIGIDRQTIIDNALNGVGMVSTGMLAIVPWANEACTFEDGRVDEAKAILDEAGWVEGPDGIREKDGVRAAFTITGRTDDLQRFNLAVAFAQDAKKLGIDITATSCTWAECKANVENIPTCYGTGDYDPAGDITGRYAMGNAALYESEMVEQRIADAQACPDPNQVNDMWKLVQWDGEQGPETDMGENPFIWLATIDHIYFVRDGLTLGEQPVHPHGHGWPIVCNMNMWAWE